MSFLQKHTHFSTDFYKVFYNKKFRLAICSNSCHSEKAENLAFSVDFRLIQNLSMLIEISLSEITLAGWVSRPTFAQSDVMLIIFMMLGWRLEITSRS